MNDLPTFLPHEKSTILSSANWVHKQRLLGSYGHRSKHSTVSLKIDNEPAILIFGGQSNESSSSGDNTIYLIQRSKENNEWYCHSPFIKNQEDNPPHLRGHSAVHYKNRVIIFGGKNNLHFFNQLYELNCLTWEWNLLITLQKVNAALFPKQKKVSNVEKLNKEHHNNLYKTTTNNNNNNNTTNNSTNNNLTNKERQLRSFESIIKLPCKRSNHSAVVLEKYGKMIIYGGITSGEFLNNNKQILGDLWEFDLNDYEWNEIEMTSNEKQYFYPCERHSHCATTLNENPNVMLIYGGSSQKDKLNDCWMFDYKSKVFTPIILWNSFMLNSFTKIQNEIQLQYYNNQLIQYLQNISSSVHPSQLLLKNNYNDNNIKQLIIPQARIDHSFIDLGNGYLLIHGGYSKKRYLKDFVIIDLQRMEYIDCNQLDRKELPSARKSHTLNHISNEFISLIGGSSRKRGKLDDFHLIDKIQLKIDLMANGDISLIESKRDLLNKKFNNNYGQQEHYHLTRNDWLEKGNLHLDLREYNDAILCFTNVINYSIESTSSINSINNFGIGINNNNNNNIDEEIKLEAFEKRALCNFMIGEYENSLNDLVSSKSYRKAELRLLEAHSHFRLGKYKEASIVMEQAKNAFKDIPIIELTKQLMDYYYEKQIYFINQLNNNNQIKRKGSMMHYANSIDDYLYEPRSSRYLDLESINKIESNELMQDKGRNEYLKGDPFNLLFIGEKKSGLTTLLLQLRILFRKSISPNESNNYKIKILNYLCQCYVKILDFCKVLKGLDKDNSPLKLSEDLDLRMNEILNVQNINDLIFDGYNSNLIKNIKYLSKDKEFLQIVKKFQKIYINLQNKYYFSSLTPELHDLLFDHNLIYFVSESDRILSENYLPTIKDILSLPFKTTFHPLYSSEDYLLTISTINGKEDNKMLLQDNHDDNFNPQFRSSESVTITEDMLMTILDENALIEDDKHNKHHHQQVYSQQQNEQQVDKNSLEFFFKRIPYSIFSTETSSSLIEIVQNIKEYNIDIITITISLGDFDKLNSLQHDQPSTPIQFCNGRIVINGKSDSSLLQGMKFIEKIVGLDGIKDKQIVFLFTHLDVFEEKMKENSTLFKDIFPNYNGKKPLQFIEDSFNIFNEKYLSLRRFHFHFLNILEKESVIKTFKEIDKIIYGVELKKRLEAYRLL
ncbi:hypothetical protein ABK040_007216 [Willaertia magna]